MQTAITCMIGKPQPLHSAELHTPPVIEPRFILLTELDPERLVTCRFGIGNMGLELHRVGPGIRGGIHKRVGSPQLAVMRLRNLGNQVSWGSAPDETPVNRK